MAGKDERNDTSLSESDRRLLEELQAFQAGALHQFAQDIEGGDPLQLPSHTAPFPADKNADQRLSNLDILNYCLFLREKGIRASNEGEFLEKNIRHFRESAVPATAVALSTFGGLRLARWGLRQFYLRQWRNQHQQSIKKSQPLYKKTAGTRTRSRNKVSTSKGTGPRTTQRRKEEIPQSMTLFMETTRFRRMAWGLLEFFISSTAAQAVMVYRKTIGVLRDSADDALQGGVSPTTDAMCEELRPMPYLMMHHDPEERKKISSSFVEHVDTLVRNCQRRQSYQRDLLLRQQSATNQNQQQQQEPTKNKQEADDVMGVAIPTMGVPVDFPYPWPSSIDVVVDPEGKQRADVLREFDPSNIVIQSSSKSSARVQDALPLTNNGGNDIDDVSREIENLLQSLDPMTPQAANNLMRDLEEDSEHLNASTSTKNNSDKR